MLPAAQAGSSDARDAARDRGRSQSGLARIRFLWTVEHRVHRAGESDHSSWGGSARTTDVGHVPTSSTTAGLTGVVARVLSLCASPPSTARGARAATRTRGQASGTTVLAAYSRYGRRQNSSTMDNSGGALVPLGADLRLRDAKARLGWSRRSWGVWRRCSQKHVNAVLLREEMAALDCLITIYRPQMGLERAGRFIHRI